MLLFTVQIVQKYSEAIGDALIYPMDEVVKLQVENVGCLE